MVQILSKDTDTWTDGQTHGHDTNILPFSKGNVLTSFAQIMLFSICKFGGSIYTEGNI